MNKVVRRDLEIIRGLHMLDPLKQEIIRNRFGLNGEEMSLGELSRKLGLGERETQRELEGALVQLRNGVPSEWTETDAELRGSELSGRSLDRIVTLLNSLPISRVFFIRGSKPYFH